MTPPKDEGLARLSELANVAQFVSFGPDSPPSLRFARLHGESFDTPFSSVEEAIGSLLARSIHASVNVRTFRVTEDDATAGKSHEFHYGLESIDAASSLVHQHAADGLHTIVNETVPVEDGGVSGVALGGSLEFSPDDTPRCVERPGTVGLPHAHGVAVLETVYGFRPDLAIASDQRLEWSLHPLRVGLRQRHTLVWELEAVGEVDVDVRLTWPNNFSRLLGDKAFGLVIADVLGAPVPHTTVVGRRVAPFTFGQATGSGERWLRTAPAAPVPGRYPTVFGWQDPYELLHGCDPHHEVTSVLAQEAVDAAYSGALLPGDDGPTIEGVAGRGDQFMLGGGRPEPLPDDVVKAVADTAEKLQATLGPVRIEWAFDGARVWVLQLQQASAVGHAATIVPGSPRQWRTFDVSEGLEALRALIDDASEHGDGIVLRGDVGVTSHLGDVLRRAGIPSRLAAGEQPAS